MLDAVPGGRRPHLLLELVEGPRLSTLERRYGIAIEQALSLGLSLASVLHYLSMRETVHLDVKPRNIIMSGPPRLIDLSVARRFSELDAVDGGAGAARHRAATPAPRPAATATTRAATTAPVAATTPAAIRRRGPAGATETRRAGTTVRATAITPATVTAPAATTGLAAATTRAARR